MRLGTPVIKSVKEYCRRSEISATPLERWVRHLLSAEEQLKRKTCLQNFCIEQIDRQGKKPPTKRSPKAYTYRYNMRTDSKPVDVRAFWAMHVEAMHWSGTGDAQYAAALGPPPTRRESGVIASRIPARRWTGDPWFIRAPGLN